MFHLYFGAFDLILYAAAFLVSLSVSRVICDDVDVSPARPVLQPAHIAADFQTSPISTSSAVSRKTYPTVASALSDKVAGQYANVIQTEVDSTNGKATVDLSNIRLFKLRKRSVVKVCDLSISLPDDVKQYKLRGESVIKLADLRKIAEVIT